MRETLRNFIVENYLFGREDAFTDDDSLLEKGIIDSTGVLELVAFVEEHYKVRVEDSELLPENLDSINRLVRFIAEKQPLSVLEESGVAS